MKNMRRYRSGCNELDSKSCYLCRKLNNYTVETYRSGRNELDSKSCGSGAQVTAESVGITGFLEISTLFNGSISTDFLRFFYVFYTGPVHGGGRANRWKYTMQRYRSGYNGPDSKSGVPAMVPWVRIPPAAPLGLRRVFAVVLFYPADTSLRWNIALIAEADCS